MLADHQVRSFRAIIPKVLLSCFLIISAHTLCAHDDLSIMPENQFNAMQQGAGGFRSAGRDKIINDVIIEGNNLVSVEAIKAKVPFIVGSIFNPRDTGKFIQTLYAMGYFRNIQVISVPDEDDPFRISLRIVVQEKKKVSEISFSGNKNYKPDALRKKIEADKIIALDEEELKAVEEKIRRAYREKNYHNITITSELIPVTDKAYKAHFTINEGIISNVKRVEFAGNKAISSKKLRTRIFTREDWLLGFLDKAGTYQPDAIDYDKHMIEDLYQSNGFLTAKVVDVQIDELSPGCLSVTFDIDEGDLYTIACVKAEGNDVLTEQQLLARIPIRPGHLYSKQMIRDTMESLRKLWGSFGYIYADVHPSVKPDEKTKTVDIEFFSDLGSKMYVNRVNIIGNKKTCDNVIRRELLFDEGELLTSYKMDESKSRVERLGYFDPKNGVNWKIIKLDDENVNLDLEVEEIRTGQFTGRIGYGNQSDIQSPATGITAALDLRDTNFLGTGIRYAANGTYSKQDSIYSFMVGTDWLIDRPIFGDINIFHRRSTYDAFKGTQQPPKEQVTGLTGRMGFRVQKLDYLQVGLSSGFENIEYGTTPRARGVFSSVGERQMFQSLINRRFQSGKLVWLDATMAQDRRNHPFMPSQGYQWMVELKSAIPTSIGNFGFFKVDADARWYTPLIEQYDLVLHLHGHLGLIAKWRDHLIPYRELYHIGGEMSVRGFDYGQIGPSVFNDSIGATKAFFVNAELQFPITRDYNIRGVVFYDGGAGWDTPDAQCIPATLLKSNNFNFRHSIGFGVRMSSPTPFKVDWGFKLDRNRKRGETAFETHFSMQQDF